MDCKAVREKMEDFRDGGMPGEDEVLKHLSGCVECRRLLAEFDSIDQRLGAVFSRIVVPAGFPGRVLAATHNIAPPVRQVWQNRIRPVMWAAAALLVLATGVLIFSRHSGTLRAANPQVASAPPFGEPFVIAGGRAVPYSGKVNVRLQRVVKGVPEYVVEAFPEKM